MATKRRPLGGRQVRPFGGGPVRPFGGRVIRPPAWPVMITGAASGIGRSLARHLSRLGSPVAADAYVFDALARVAPTHYYDVMAQLEKRLRAASR